MAHFHGLWRCIDIHILAKKPIRVIVVVVSIRKETTAIAIRAVNGRYRRRRKIISP
jgi:hypothetical protein